MDTKSNTHRDVCCHGYERPKTSHSFPKTPHYIKTPPETPPLEPRPKSRLSIGLQTDEFQQLNTPPRCKTSLSPWRRPTQSPNDFYQRYRNAQVRGKRLIPADTPLEQLLPPGTVVIGPSTSQGPPVFRSGRMGSSWRHMKRVTGPNGENIMFIDGTVKEADCLHYPPHGYPSLRVIPADQLYRKLLQNSLLLGNKTPNNIMNYDLRRHLTSYSRAESEHPIRRISPRCDSVSSSRASSQPPHIVSK